ncbi:uncharacterized protein TNCV_4927951 [Trichonephila clavipes]|nr:uncharacterized protein TNCV_4927951 [Trichonephila clavipes]
MKGKDALKIDRCSDDQLGKNRLRIFTLRLTGGAHRYHCSRRKQKPTSDVNKTLTGGAQRTSLNQSPGDQSRGFSTADSLWLGTRACAVLAISLRCQSMFRYFTARLKILTLKLGEWGATSVVLLVTQLKFQITRSLSVEFVTPFTNKFAIVSKYFPRSSYVRGNTHNIDL